MRSSLQGNPSPPREGWGCPGLALSTRSQAHTPGRACPLQPDLPPEKTLPRDPGPELCPAVPVAPAGWRACRRRPSPHPRVQGCRWPLQSCHCVLWVARGVALVFWGLHGAGCRGPQASRRLATEGVLRVVEVRAGLRAQEGQGRRGAGWGLGHEFCLWRLELNCRTCRG